MAGGFIVVTTPRDGRLADWLVGPVAFTGTLGAAAILAVFSQQIDPAARLGIMASATAVISWFARPRVAMLAAILSFLMFDAFVVDRFGELRWHGAHDLTRIAFLVATAIGASCFRATLTAMRRKVLLEEFAFTTQQPPTEAIPAASAVSQPVSQRRVRGGR